MTIPYIYNEVFSITHIVQAILTLVAIWIVLVLLRGAVKTYWWLTKDFWITLGKIFRWIFTRIAQ